MTSRSQCRKGLVITSTVASAHHLFETESMGKLESDVTWSLMILSPVKGLLVIGAEISHKYLYVGIATRSFPSFMMDFWLRGLLTWFQITLGFHEGFYLIISNFASAHQRTYFETESLPWCMMGKLESGVTWNHMILSPGSLWWWEAVDVMRDKLSHWRRKEGNICLHAILQRNV